MDIDAGRPGRAPRAPGRSGPQRATVIARWEADRGLLRVENKGTVFSVTVPEELRTSFDVGIVVWIVCDFAGRLIRWFVDDVDTQPGPVAAAGAVSTS